LPFAPLAAKESSDNDGPMKKSRHQKKPEQSPAPATLKPGGEPQPWWWHAVAVLGLLLVNLAL